MFSLTSSTVDQAVRAAAPLISPHDDEVYFSFKKVLGYAGLEKLLQDELAVVPPLDLTTHQTQQNSTDATTLNNNQEIDTLLQDELADVPPLDLTTHQTQQTQQNSTDATRLNNNTAGEDSDDSGEANDEPTTITPQPTSDPATTFIESIEACEDDVRNNEDINTTIDVMSVHHMTEVLTKLGLKKPSAPAKLRKSVKAWAFCDPDKRPYFQKTNAELKILLNQRRIKLPGNATKLQMEELLIGHDKNQAQLRENTGRSIPQVLVGVQQPNVVEEHQAVGGNDSASPDPVLCAVLQASLLKKQAGAKRSATRKGIALEKPLMSEMWFDCQKTEDSRPANLPKFRALYSPGLVSKMGKPYVKDSADGIAIIQCEPTTNHNESSSTTLEVVPVEVKARVAVNTQFKERLNLQAMLGVDCYSSNERPYLSISSKDLSDWVPSNHEQFQLLHHAY
jgi:hypothetical protein